MAVPDRSVATIVQGILENLQDLVRSEVALAKREIAEDIGRGKSAVVVISAGAITTLIGIHFLLWAAIYALGLRLPMWAAAAIVGGTLTAGGAIVVASALRRWRLLSFTPERTVATLKEDVEWVKQSIK